MTHKGPVKKVLIVDDSPLLQTLVKDSLLREDMDLSIGQAFNCKEAAELIASFKPETLILDIGLPDGSGIEILQKIKKDNHEIKVIMFTNFPSGEFKNDCMELGADHFINKSDLTELIKIITR